MRRPFRDCKPVGIAMACAGAFIVIALILPTGFWWFFLGVLLIVVGLCLIRNCF